MSVLLALEKGVREGEGGEMRMGLDISESKMSSHGTKEKISLLLREVYLPISPLVSLSSFG